MKNLKQRILSQSGRSMVEVLGVVAIIGVLSICALTFYAYLIDKHHANILSDEILQRSLDIKKQLDNRKRNITLDKFDPQSKLGYTIDYDNVHIGIQVYDVPKRLCDMTLDQVKGVLDSKIYSADGKTLLAECEENNTLVFVFEKVKTSKRQKGCPAGTPKNADPDTCECDLTQRYWEEATNTCVCWSEVEINGECVKSCTTSDDCDDNEVCEEHVCIKIHEYKDRETSPVLYTSTEAKEDDMAFTSITLSTNEFSTSTEFVLETKTSMTQYGSTTTRYTTTPESTTSTVGSTTTYGSTTTRYTTTPESTTSTVGSTTTYGSTTTRYTTTPESTTSTVGSTTTYGSTTTRYTTTPVSTTSTVGSTTTRYTTTPASTTSTVGSTTTRYTTTPASTTSTVGSTTTRYTTTPASTTRTETTTPETTTPETTTKKEVVKCTCSELCGCDLDLNEKQPHEMIYPCYANKSLAYKSGYDGLVLEGTAYYAYEGQKICVCDIECKRKSGPSASEGG